MNNWLQANRLCDRTRTTYRYIILNFISHAKNAHFRRGVWNQCIIISQLANAPLNIQKQCECHIKHWKYNCIICKRAQRAFRKSPAPLDALPILLPWLLIGVQQVPVGCACQFCFGNWHTHSRHFLLQRWHIAFYCEIKHKRPAANKQSRQLGLETRVLDKSQTCGNANNKNSIARCSWICWMLHGA